MRKPTPLPSGDSPRSDSALERARDAEAPVDRTGQRARDRAKDVGKNSDGGDAPGVSSLAGPGAEAERALPDSESEKGEAAASPGDSLIWPPPEEELNGWEIIQLESTGRTLIEPMRPMHDSGSRLTATPLPAPATPPPAPRLYSTIPTPPALPVQAEPHVRADAPVPAGGTPPHLSLRTEADENLPETQVIEPFIDEAPAGPRSLDRPTAPARPSTSSAPPPAPPQAPRHVPPQVIVQGGPVVRASVSAREQTQPRIVVSPPGTPSIKVTVPHASLDDTVDPSAQTRIMAIPHDLLRMRPPASMVETLRDDDTAPVKSEPRGHARPPAPPAPARAAAAPPSSVPHRAGIDSWRPDPWKAPDSFRTDTSAMDLTPPLPLKAMGSVAATPAAALEADSVDTTEERRTPVWRMALIVITLVAIAEVAYLLVRTLQPSAATGLPATFVVESTPSGAEVSIDGAPKGRTPFRGELSPGTHELDVRSGTLRQTRTVTLQPGALLTERVELGGAPVVPAPASTAALEVRSEPSGARVTIGGVDRGRTPVMVSGLQPGRVQIHISGPFKATREVTLSAGQQARLVVNAPRAPDPAPTTDPGDATPQPTGPNEAAPPRTAPLSGRGWITIDSPLVLRVVRNGDFLGTSEDRRIPLPAGMHVIGLENESVNFREVRTIEVQPNRGAALSVTLPQGALSINALPWAEVLVDNQVVGETPVSQLALLIGPHEIVFRHPQFGERRVTVIVKVGTPGRTFVDFTK